jgi:hypothetical protein
MKRTGLDIHVQAGGNGERGLFSSIDLTVGVPGVRTNGDNTDPWKSGELTDPYLVSR